VLLVLLVGVESASECVCVCVCVTRCDCVVLAAAPLPLCALLFTGCDDVPLVWAALLVFIARIVVLYYERHADSSRVAGEERAIHRERERVCVCVCMSMSMCVCVKCRMGKLCTL